MKDTSYHKALRTAEGQACRCDTLKLIQMAAELVRSGIWGLWLDGK